MNAALPRSKTRFFGRTGDLAKLEALCGEGTSLIALWGPPGIGKTRLAIELCRRVPRASFCDLSAARDEAEICACVMRVLGVDALAGGDANRVAMALAAHAPGVIVLDNFEHVAPFATAIVEAWLDAAPRMTFVATSRSRLRLDGEVAHEVMPLPEARELFLDRSGERATRMDPDEVAALVSRLDGIPLAIELAAARALVLGVAGLLARLDRPHGAFDKAGALELAIDASFQSLPLEQRRVLAQCAVFRGSFTVDEAEAVVSSPSVIDTLETLRDRSLLRCLSDDDAVRFSFFESIRVHAAEALRETGDEPATRRRHARHCLSRASCDPANLTDALTWTLSDDATTAELARDALAALTRMDPSVLTDALLERLERVLAQTSNEDDRALRSRGHRTLARALLLRGKVEPARAELERALELAPREARGLAADLWADIGVLEHQRGDLEHARACYEKALGLGDEKVARARFVGNLGTINHDARLFDEALARYEEAIASFRAAGERQLEGTFLTNMAILLHETGAPSRARATFHLALERLERTSAKRMEAIARTNLGLLCHELGDLDAARACHEQALALFRRVTDVRSEGLCLGRLAMTLAAQGHHHDAAARCERAERTLRSVDDFAALEVWELFRAYVDLVRTRDGVLAREQLLHARVLTSRSDDARTTMRLIERELVRDGAAARVLVVGPDASWFVPPDDTQHDLGNRHVLRRLLLRLVEHHRAAPGAGLTLDELRVAGWPDERVTAVAALNRVHVALTELRRRGLRSCLQRAESRYLIDPSVRIELREG